MPTDQELIKIVPSKRQLKYQETEFYAFFHFGMNTYTNREWGDGTEAVSYTHLDVYKRQVLNCWGKMRSWGNHMVHHAIYYKQNYSYFGIIEALSGAPFDVSFISFDDILENKDLLKNFDVVINVGDADTAQSLSLIHIFLD